MNGNIFNYSRAFWSSYQYSIKARNPVVVLFAEVLSKEDEKELEKLRWMLPEKESNKINLHLIVLSPNLPTANWPCSSWCIWFRTPEGVNEIGLVLAQQLASLISILPDVEIKILYRTKTISDASVIFKAWGSKCTSIDPNLWDIDITLLVNRSLYLSHEAILLRGLLHNRRAIQEKQGKPPDLCIFLSQLHERLGPKVQHLTEHKIRHIDNYFRMPAAQ